MNQRPTQEDIETIKTMIQSGTTLTKIANAMSTSVTYIDHLITQLNLEKPADVRRRRGGVAGRSGGAVRDQGVVH